MDTNDAMISRGDGLNGRRPMPRPIVDGRPLRTVDALDRIFARHPDVTVMHGDRRDYMRSRHLILTRMGTVFQILALNDAKQVVVRHAGEQQGEKTRSFWASFESAKYVEVQCPHTVAREMMDATRKLLGPRLQQLKINHDFRRLVILEDGCELIGPRSYKAPGIVWWSNIRRLIDEDIAALRADGETAIPGKKLEKLMDVMVERNWYRSPTSLPSMVIPGEGKKPRPIPSEPEDDMIHDASKEGYACHP